MMTKTKTLIATGAAAAVLAGGGVAYAAQSTTSPSTPTTTPGAGQQAGTAAKSHHGKDRDRLPGLDRIEHGQFVTKDKSGQQVTHDVATGTITAVSATSISVKDGTGQTDTFVVDAKTRVHVKGQAKGTKSTIGSLKTGETATVLGTGTGPFTAQYVAAH